MLRSRSCLPQFPGLPCVLSQLAVPSLVRSRCHSPAAKLPLPPRAALCLRARCPVPRDGWMEETTRQSPPGAPAWGSPCRWLPSALSSRCRSPRLSESR